VQSSLLALAFLFCSIAHGMTLRNAVAAPQLRCTLRGDGRAQLVVEIFNRGAEKTAVDIPAGLIATAASGARIATIRAASLEIAAGGKAEAVIPAVPFSASNRAQDESYAATNDEMPALRPLLDYSAKTNDLPRPTAQLTALLLLEDVSAVKWCDFLGHEPTADEIATAIDALALAQQLAPAKTFALAQDADLRLRALRQPLVRAKAMQVFGIIAPEGVPVPDIKQLLHIRPGDNCPICRMRAQMEKAVNGL
jgi:hypothetical protein